MNDLQHDVIENILYADIEIGDSSRLIRTLTLEDIRAFAAVSGDVNPAHLDASFANESMFHGIIGHGMWSGSLVSTVLGTQFPGPGTIYLEQSFRFKRPVRVGDTLTVIVTVLEKHDEKHILVLACSITNQNGDEVVSGQARVIAPSEKIIRPRIGTPKLNVFDPEVRVRHFIESVTPTPPVVAAYVHPTSEVTLLAAQKLLETGTVTPVLIAPLARLEAIARELQIDLGRFELREAKHSHHAAELAVALANAGEVEMLCRGDIDKQELMLALRACKGMETKTRLSHVLRFDVPLYDKPLWLTDAVLNHRPSLEEKVDIVQNAIRLVEILGSDEPRVAVLSAVDTIDPEYPSTLHAAALCKMSDRGQIRGGRLDGPLAFDQAVASQTNLSITGASDILLAPDSESANMLAKQLEFFAGASSAGIVMGARVPIALTMRNASSQSLMLSGILAARVAEHYRDHQP
jgi:phosphate acetyltransferase